MASLILLLLVPALLGWLFFAQIPVYEVSATARLEVLAEPQSVASAVEGRVVSSKLRVGVETAIGDDLVVLDGDIVRHAVEESRQQIVSAELQLEALATEISALEIAIEVLEKARALAVQESQAQLSVAETQSRFAKQRQERAELLASKNAMAKEELEGVRAASESSGAQLEAARLTVARGEQDRLAEEQGRRVELARLHQDAAELQGAVATGQAVLKRLEYDLELRTIRAYVAGRIAEVVPFRVGSVVQPSEKLATIVPPGESRVVAQLPVIAVGRVMLGQSARLRMDGFPWSQYGTLSAVVTGVGNEPSDGLIRVELSVDPDPNSRIPLQHGQTGAVEIEVERASPAMLILRAAGQKLMTRRPAASG